VLEELGDFFCEFFEMIGTFGGSRLVREKYMLMYSVVTYNYQQHKVNSSSRRSPATAEGHHLTFWFTIIKN